MKNSIQQKCSSPERETWSLAPTKLTLRRTGKRHRKQPFIQLMLDASHSPNRAACAAVLTRKFRLIVTLAATVNERTEAMSPKQIGTRQTDRGLLLGSSRGLSYSKPVTACGT
jgi:hypothetical protein